MDKVLSCLNNSSCNMLKITFHSYRIFILIGFTSYLGRLAAVPKLFLGSHGSALTPLFPLAWLCCFLLNISCLHLELGRRSTGEGRASNFRMHQVIWKIIYVFIENVTTLKMQKNRHWIVLNHWRTKCWFTRFNENKIFRQNLSDFSDQKSVSSFKHMQK